MKRWLLAPMAVVALLVPMAPASADVTSGLSGVVTDASGGAVGAHLWLRDPATYNTVASVDTDDAGGYAMSVSAGTYLFGFTADVTDPATGGAYQVSAQDPITVTSGGLTEDVALPVLAQVDLTITDAQNSPVTAGSVRVDRGTVSVTDNNGATLRMSLGSGNGPYYSIAVDGTASFVALLGSTATVVVSPPAATTYTTSVPVTGNPTTAAIQLPSVTMTTVMSGVVTDASGGAVGAHLWLRDPATYNTVASADTDDAGGYAMSVSAGTYLFGFTADVTDPATGGAYQVSAQDPITVTSGGLTEDVALPVLAQVDLTITDAQNSPVTAGSVRVDRGTVSVTDNNGATLRMSLGSGNGPYYSIAVDGTASFVALLGSTATVVVSPPAATTYTTSVPVTGNPTTAAIQLPSVTMTTVMSGVVTDASGGAVGAHLWLRDPATYNTVASVDTDDAGGYAMSVSAGTYLFGFTADVTDPATGGAYQVSAQDPITVTSGGLTEDVALPVLAQVDLTITDAQNSPVTAGSVRVDRGTVSVTDNNGATLRMSLGSDNGPYYSIAADGTASFVALLGSTATVVVSPPAATTYTTSVPVTGNPTTAAIQDRNFGQVASTGSTPGRVAVSVPDGLVLQDLQSSAAETPAGTSAVAGAIGYQIVGMHVGGSADAILSLPGNVTPDAVFKLADGVLSDVTTRTSVDGNTIRIHLVDGGFGDADGTPNGVIVDPIVPTVRTPLSIDSAALSPATIGVPYKTSLRATGGNGHYVWKLVSGNLPTGLTLNKNGTLVGTAKTPGVGLFVVTVRDTSKPAQSASANISVHVDPRPLIISTTTLPVGHVGSKYHLTFAATGGWSAKTWKLTSGGLPAGLIITRAGTISGKPKVASHTNLAVTVTDAIGATQTATYTLVIVAS